MMEMKLYFSDLTDTRDNRGLRHEIGNLIVMSIYAVLCGYTDAENMAFFMKLQEPYFQDMLDLKYGVPSADTLLRVFALIEPEKFMEMFYHWIQNVLLTLCIIYIIIQTYFFKFPVVLLSKLQYNINMVK